MKQTANYTTECSCLWKIIQMIRYKQSCQWCSTAVSEMANNGWLLPASAVLTETRTTAWSHNYSVHIFTLIKMQNYQAISRRVFSSVGAKMLSYFKCPQSREHGNSWVAMQWSPHQQKGKYYSWTWNFMMFEWMLYSNPHVSRQN